MTILCMNKVCDSPAMLDRLPGRKSNKFLVRHCFPCAMKFYTATPAQLVQTALVEYNRATFVHLWGRE